MEMQKVEIEVTKEAHELGMAVANLVKAVKASLDDGFQVGTDIPAIVMVAFQELPKAIEGLDKLDDEAKAALKPFIMALVLPITDAVESLLKKQA